MTTKQLEVNGRIYTVARDGEHAIELRGPRGGAAVLVQNIHSGRWVLIEGNSMRPRVHQVETMSEVH